MAGQTLAEIRSVLAGAGISPLHRFGQNFLIDLNLMRKVVDTADVQPDDVILEVGPGTGSLTEILLERGAQVIAVEIDRGLQNVLRQRLADSPRFALIPEDILAGKHKINTQVLETLKHTRPGPDGTRKLVANLPYNVATPLLMELLHVRPTVTRMTVTIQREVGERIAAHSGGRDYGPLSVIMQTVALTHLVAILPPSVFWPAPKVESVLVDIRCLPSERVPIRDIPGFIGFVQRAFQNRRKTLRRIFKEMEQDTTMVRSADTLLDRARVNPRARPAELSPTQWQTAFRAAQPADGE